MKTEILAAFPICISVPLTTLNIGELLLTANSPSLSDLKIWRVTVNG